MWNNLKLFPKIKQKRSSKTDGVFRINIKNSRSTDKDTATEGTGPVSTDGQTHRGLCKRQIRLIKIGVYVSILAAGLIFALLFRRKNNKAHFIHKSTS